MPHETTHSNNLLGLHLRDAGDAGARPESRTSVPPPTVEQAAGQQSDLPELTLSQAVEQAVANNSSLKTASLETRRAADDLAATRTRRFANTQVTALGAQLVTKPSVTYPAGALGVYSATGPIPATNQKVEIPRKPVGIVNVLVAQPLSTQYQLRLQLKALALGLEGTRQEQVKTRLEVVDQVRRAYYAVVEAQSALDSFQASLPYYRESHRLAFVSRGKETILESDLLNAAAQLLKIQNAIRDASDRVASTSEGLNDLMGRDVHAVPRCGDRRRRYRSRHTQSHGSPRPSKPARCEEGEASGAASQLRRAGEEGGIYPRRESGIQLLHNSEFPECFSKQRRDSRPVASVGTVGLGTQAP